MVRIDIQGTDLARMKKPLPWLDVLELGTDLARGLAAMHERDVSHLPVVDASGNLSGTDVDGAYVGAIELSEALAAPDDPFLIPLRVVWLAPMKKTRRAASWWVNSESRCPFASATLRSTCTARSRSPSRNQVSPLKRSSAAMKAQVSSARPQPRTGSASPERV